MSNTFHVIAVSDTFVRICQIKMESVHGEDTWQFEEAEVLQIVDVKIKGKLNLTQACRIVTKDSEPVHAQGNEGDFTEHHHCTVSSFFAFHKPRKHWTPEVLIKKLRAGKVHR